MFWCGHWQKIKSRSLNIAKNPHGQVANDGKGTLMGTVAEGDGEERWDRVDQNIKALQAWEHFSIILVPTVV